MKEEDQLHQIWRQVGQMEVEHARLKRELDRLEENGSQSGLESAELEERLKGLKEQLLQLDREYSALLRRENWGEN